jgi:predicted kinase
VLISVTGLPAAGKTTIVRQLATEIGAVHICIDTIEQSLRASRGTVQNFYKDAYEIGYAVAADNLRLGRVVIAGCVNATPLTRDRWLDVAQHAEVRVIEVEVTCTDQTELNRRIEMGAALDPPGGSPRWQQVARFYEPLSRPHIVIDTAGRTVAESVAELRAALVSNGRSSDPVNG